MKLTKRLTAALSLLSFVLLSSISLQAFAAPQGYMMDMLTLQPGKTMADAEAYFERIKPIINKHGLYRIKLYSINKKMMGSDALQPQIVNLWRLESKDALAKIFEDPKYQKNVKRRNKTFDMSKLEMWFLDDKPF